MQWMEGSPNAFSHGTQVVVLEGINVNSQSCVFPNKSATLRQQKEPS